MNTLLAQFVHGGAAIGGLVQLLIVVIVLGAIWYIFNLIPNVPPIMKQVVTIIACAALAIYAIMFLASFL